MKQVNVKSILRKKNNTAVLYKSVVETLKNLEDFKTYKLNKVLDRNDFSGIEVAKMINEEISNSMIIWDKTEIYGLKTKDNISYFISIRIKENGN